MAVESYSQRLLNPFRGVQRVIRHGAAEAVTTDGAHWDIYVSNDELLQGLDRSHPVLISEIRFGRWSADKGLKRGPLYPSADFRRMERMGAAVYEALVQIHDQPVFPFRDGYELWLLDRGGMPLALLASVLGPEEMELDLPLAWRPGHAAVSGFRSGVCEGACEYLSGYINGLAGPAPAAAWLQRLADGSGRAVAGINMPKAWSGRIWAGTDFPVFFLGEGGHDPRHRQLLQDFHAWQAPCLLLLPGLAVETRCWLEDQARQQAEAVDRLFRLYPASVDPRLIDAARVEAMLRRSQPMPPTPDEALSTFYIELNPSETGVD